MTFRKYIKSICSIPTLNILHACTYIFIGHIIMYNIIFTYTRTRFEITNVYRDITEGARRLSRKRPDASCRRIAGRAKASFSQPRAAIVVRAAAIFRYTVAIVHTYIAIHAIPLDTTALNRSSAFLSPSSPPPSYSSCPPASKNAGAMPILSRPAVKVREHREGVHPAMIPLLADFYPLPAARAPLSSTPTSMLP